MQCDSRALLVGRHKLFQECLAGRLEAAGRVRVAGQVADVGSAAAVARRACGGPGAGRPQPRRRDDPPCASCRGSGTTAGEAR